MSFALESFKDKKLTIQRGIDSYLVDSIHTPQYLVQNYNGCLNINRKQILQIMYEDTRIDCSTMEDHYGADILENDEFDELIKSFNKFVEHESWESIACLLYTSMTRLVLNLQVRIGENKMKA